MTYVDGLVLPVKKRQLATYRSMFEHDLGGAEDVARRDEADVHVAHPDGLAIRNADAVLRPVADLHGQGARRRVCA